ncbi:hypothetical protein PCASD_16453 [Puccinia coronata f. sp. avenae]|uniref:Uncharacterized protein n=1 Tax=Puccinia coronata f. sp. avenae TaxID=200324 RepID=A0A2N5U3M0_9BASI|nr:hypothetical protein PCASD_16453 [Puccinia coronata f. sp. avenae]
MANPTLHYQNDGFPAHNQGIPNLNHTVFVSGQHNTRLASDTPTSLGTTLSWSPTGVAPLTSHALPNDLNTLNNLHGTQGSASIASGVAPFNHCDLSRIISPTPSGVTPFTPPASALATGSVSRKHKKYVASRATKKKSVLSKATYQAAIAGRPPASNLIGLQSDTLRPEIGETQLKDQDADVDNDLQCDDEQIGLDLSMLGSEDKETLPSTQKAIEATNGNNKSRMVLDDEIAQTLQEQPMDELRRLADEHGHYERLTAEDRLAFEEIYK